MPERSQAVAEIVAAGRRLHEAGILVSIEGNLSVRLDDGTVLATPSGVDKGRLEPDQVVRVDTSGRPLGDGEPSSELPMHLAVYDERSDVRAIVHAHPTAATGFAVAGVELPGSALAEAVTSFGCVPIVPYRTPSTSALAASVREPIRDFDAILLANHGAVTVGTGLEEATDRMLQVEHFAKIAAVSHLLGGPRSLAREQVEALSAIRERQGAGAVPPACYPSTRESGTITLTHGQLVDLIVDALRTLR